MTMPDCENLPEAAEAVAGCAMRSFAAAERTETPYTWWSAYDVLPTAAATGICELPFAAPKLGGVSGKRELHNGTRTYFDAGNRARYPVVEAVAQAFQSAAMIGAVESRFETELAGSYLRIEYAQDIDGFWLQPHSDLGVKLFTLLLYLSDDPAHADLGTDVYTGDKQHFTTAPFRSNSAMIFVPADDTFHGFERRPIAGVRKSLIINYVTDEWRERQQLAFPDSPIRG